MGTSASETYSEIHGKEEWIWNVPMLWAAAAKAVASGAARIQFRPLRELPRFEALSWSKGPITEEELDEHLERIRIADLELPIILSANGDIMDGLHRLAKAILMHHESIKVIQFSMTPPPDQKVQTT
jgi:hypothetical protein